MTRQEKGVFSPHTCTALARSGGTRGRAAVKSRSFQWSQQQIVVNGA